MKNFGNQIFIILAVLSVLAFVSCEKDPGEGGRGLIKGKLFGLDFNSLGILNDSFYVHDERVYIIYGDNEIFDDDTRTNFDGSFQFDFLYPGRYRIFAYSFCDTCASLEEPIFYEVELETRADEVEIPDLRIKL